MNTPPLIAFPSEFRFNLDNYHFQVGYFDKFLRGFTL